MKRVNNAHFEPLPQENDVPSSDEEQNRGIVASSTTQAKAVEVDIEPVEVTDAGPARC